MNAYFYQHFTYKIIIECLYFLQYFCWWHFESPQKLLVNYVANVTHACLLHKVVSHACYYDEFHAFVRTQTSDFNISLIQAINNQKNPKFYYKETPDGMGILFVLYILDKVAWVIKTIWAYHLFTINQCITKDVSFFILHMTSLYNRYLNVHHLKIDYLYYRQIKCFSACHFCNVISQRFYSSNLPLIAQ